MSIKTKLEHRKEKIADDELQKFVAEDVLDNGDDESLEDYMKGVLNHGCVSGRVSCLIYHRDTFAFFDKFYQEIEWLRHEYEENTGMKLEPQGSYLKNRFARWAYEETIRQIADYLELER